MDNDYLLNTAQAAAYLNVKHQTMEAWRSRKQGPVFIRLGPHLVRYRRSDLDAFIDERAHTPKSHQE